MKYALEPFEALVKEGYLRKSETPDLILYGYTDRCTYDRHWNEYTTIARGLILEKSTGEVVAKCFPKFFNLGEQEETKLENLPAETGYEVHEKADGSLGIIFYYQGKWNVATRGSFYSEQAQKAQQLLSNYNMVNVDPNTTLLVEIVYPENRIIVDYGATEELVLLAAYDRVTGEERGAMSVVLTSFETGMRKAIRHKLTINQMIKLQKTMPRQEEGFVVRFGSGLRVKIKGDEYMAVAKMLSRMSPISFWESMVDGVVNTDYLAQLPEELRPRYEPIVAELQTQFAMVLGEIGQDLQRLPTVDVSTKENQKAIGLFIQTPGNVKHSGAIFPALKENQKALEYYVMKQIRPDGNKLKVL